MPAISSGTRGLVRSASQPMKTPPAPMAKKPSM